MRVSLQLGRVFLRSYYGVTTRGFAKASRAIGPNDQVKILKLKAKQAEEKRKVRGYPNYSLVGLNRQLPPGSYRGSFRTKQLDGYNDLVKRALSVHTGNRKEVKKARMVHLISMFGQHEYDVAGPAIQTAMLCEQVLSLVQHMKKNRSDCAGSRALQTKLSHRQRALAKLKGKNYCHFAQIMRYYGLVDQNLAMDKTNFRCRRWKPY